MSYAYSDHIARRNARVVDYEDMRREDDAGGEWPPMRTAGGGWGHGAPANGPHVVGFVGIDDVARVVEFTRTPRGWLPGALEYPAAWRKGSAMNITPAPIGAAAVRLVGPPALVRSGAMAALAVGRTWTMEGALDRFVVDSAGALPR